MALEVNGGWRLRFLSTILRESRFLRSAAWKALVRREAAFLRSVSRARPLPGLVPVGFDQALAQSDSEVFFVLGNGNSVNDLASEDFDTVAKNFSVGLNAWPLHPFVPNAYSFELWTGLGRNQLEIHFLFALAEKKAYETSAALWLLRPKPKEFDQLAALIRSLPGVCFGVYGRANISSPSLRSLDRDVGNSLRYLRHKNRAEVLLDDGASVVRMISLGLLHGFKKIVLVGVDLTETPYFWYDRRFIDQHGDHRDICRRQPEEGTDTLSTESRPFSTQDFISSLARVAKSDFGAEIFVASPKSRLAQELGVFNFHRGH